MISLITINKETFLYPLYEKKKTKYFANLNINEVTDKNFWKTIKHCFSGKSKNSEKIFLIENDEIAMKIAKLHLH